MFLPDIIPIFQGVKIQGNVKDLFLKIEGKERIENKNYELILANA
jgi:hypothetical protein